jgi:ubiquinone/menaquinone biosynthesis C-methylase UbiE
MLDTKDYFLEDGAYPWWDRGRIDFLPMETRLLRENLRDGSVADIGIGKGRIELNLERNEEFVGIDISLAMLKEAKQRLRTRSLSVELIQCDAEDLPFKDKSFDSSFCFEALMHIPNTDRVIQEMRRITKQDVFLHFNIRSPKLLWRLVSHGKVKEFSSLLSGYYPVVRRILGRRTIWKAFNYGYVKSFRPEKEWKLDLANVVVKL